MNENIIPDFDLKEVQERFQKALDKYGDRLFNMIEVDRFQGEDDE